MEKWEKRDRKRDKKRKMKMSGRSVQTLDRIIKEKALEAAEELEEERKSNE